MRLLGKIVVNNQDVHVLRQIIILKSCLVDFIDKVSRRCLVEKCTAAKVSDGAPIILGHCDVACMQVLVNKSSIVGFSVEQETRTNRVLDDDLDLGQESRVDNRRFGVHHQ